MLFQCGCHVDDIKSREDSVKRQGPLAFNFHTNSLQDLVEYTLEEVCEGDPEA